ncbi:hypothetical protein IMZ08_04125 [Bacillus luteolus]|uniref:Tetratricopeptide repeat protein n=1 Tax=Litchfieldia luteola TaxID=682179 RepID=A0ABR9QFQ3_9BACI|nr:hypothetical protein [Cytobacillus luteolus]MBE4907246.1 hypothetical protein [Cytobacillus luteolus]MBP1943277.1 tetratricopeptide (TPR) repeat protein [Cytobacillus luteolus]
MDIVSGQKELQLIDRQIKAEQYEDAVNHLETLIKNDVNGQNYLEVRQIYAEALQSNPMSAPLHATYGYLLLLKGFEEEALKRLERALKLNPTNQIVNNHIQKFYIVITEVANQNEIDKLLNNSGPEIQRLVKNAMIKELHGDIKEAKEFYRKAAQLDPENKLLLILLERAIEKAHPMYLPHRLMNKIGGSGIFWVIVMTVLFIVYYMMYYVAAIVIAISYIFFLVYIWKTPKLYKRIKGRRR